MLTRELIVENHWDTMTPTLSYYEMGVLIKEHDSTHMNSYELGELYPDLNFWRWG